MWEQSLHYVICQNDQRDQNKRDYLDNQIALAVLNLVNTPDKTCRTYCKYDTKHSENGRGLFPRTGESASRPGLSWMKHRAGHQERQSAHHDYQKQTDHNQQYAQNPDSFGTNHASTAGCALFAAGRIFYLAPVAITEIVHLCPLIFRN
jgi:hypothetical protein